MEKQSVEKSSIGEYISEHVNELIESNYNKATIKDYLACLNRFQRYLMAAYDDVPLIQEIKMSDIENFLFFLRIIDYDSEFISIHLSVLNAFYTHLEDDLNTQWK